MNIDRTSISYVESIAQKAGIGGAVPVMKTITIDYSNALGGNPVIQISQDGSNWEEPKINNLYTINPHGTFGTIYFNAFRYFTSTYNGSATPRWRLRSGNQVSEAGTLTAPGKLPTALRFKVQNDAINDFGKSKSQFKNSLYVTIPALANKISELGGPLTFLPHLTQIKIEAKDSVTTYGKTITNISYGASQNHSIALTNVQGSCNIKITITDAFERTWTYEIGTYTKINNLSPFTGSLSLNSHVPPIKPYSNQTAVKFSLPTFTNSGIGQLRYLYSFSYGSRKEEFQEDLNTQKSEYSMTKKNFNNKIINLFKQVTGLGTINDQYTVKLDLTISNGFEAKSFSTSFGVNFIESPIITSNKITLRYNGSEVTDGMIFNANEKITFDEPITSDPNNDVVSYEIGWTHDTKVDITGANIKQQLEYVIPAVSTNVNRWFAIRAKDSKGNTSAWSPYHKIVIGRTSSPVFSITNLEAEDKGNVTKLSFKINVADFGGVFRERGTPEIKIELGSNINSMTPVTITYQGDQPYTREFGIKKAETMYARFTLIVPYGAQGNKISKVSQVFTIGKLPTVVYRPNRIGINTTNLKAGSFLTLQTSDQGNNITLTTGGTDEIVIDLAERTIDGLTITCGRW